MSSEPATFLFADIAGFTALTEAHGVRAGGAVAGDFCRAVTAELPPHRRTQVKTIGDAVMLRLLDPVEAIVLGHHIVNDLMQDHGAPAIQVGLHHGPAIERTATTSGRP